MLSILAIISIFIEIFSCGVLIGSGFSFLGKFLKKKSFLNLALVLFFFLFSIYIGLTITSQLMFCLDRSISELIVINKIIFIILLFDSFLVFVIFKDKFNLGNFKIIKFLFLIFILAVIFLTLRIVFAEVNLVYRENVIEPIVDFLEPIPVKFLWVSVWILFALFSLAKAFKSTSREKNLLYLSFFASTFIFSSEIVKFFYVTTGDSTYLVVSWLLILFASIFLFLGEGISPESEIAENPFNFFRTRILFKLILIFVLLIVILFEATTIATININREALSQAVKMGYLEVARSLSHKIEYAAVTDKDKLDINKVQKFVSEVTQGKRYAFVTDGKGNLIAHSDPLKAKLKKNLNALQPVNEALKGMEGGLEFKDETGEEKVGAYTFVKKFNLAVVVEEPVKIAYSEIRRLEVNTLIFVITGIILTVLVGVFFARSIERPILKVIEGTEAVRKGDLDYKIEIESFDEIGKLAAAFNLMTSDLRDTQEHLISSEKLAALGTMAAGMAHEIKNPLVSLRTFTQLLQQKFDDPEFRKKFSSIVPQEIERINRIAESLLKFGRPTKPELTPVDINGILKEVLDLFENELRKSDIRVTTKFTELPEIVGDPNQLRQAFVNIVLNAIQAMEGGGELIIKTDFGEVIRLKPAKKKSLFGRGQEFERLEEEEKIFSRNIKPIPVVFVEITDTGPGIEESVLKNIFDPFFTTKVSGTGMGLPITLRIIEEHGGSIKVKSQVGKGTTFIITLPQKSNKSS